MQEAETSHEEAIEAREEMETQETNEEATEVVTPEPEKAEKSTDRQPTAKEFQAVDGARKAFEKENKRLKEELAARISQPTDGDPMVSVALGKALADISLEEAESIVTYAKGKFNNLKPTPEQIIQASKDTFVMDAIKSQREKVAAENKTPSPSSPSSVIGGKTKEELVKMSDKDYTTFIKENVSFNQRGRGI